MKCLRSLGITCESTCLYFLNPFLDNSFRNSKQNISCWKWKKNFVCFNCESTKGKSVFFQSFVVYVTSTWIHCLRKISLISFYICLILIAFTLQNPKKFEDVFDEMIYFLEQTDHWDNTEMELAARGVSCISEKCFYPY